jgi:hypothetical protein
MEQVKSPVFWMLLVVMILTVIVAVGNWTLYSRVATLETNYGLRATPR